jgi:hypothetical protein
MTGEEVNHTVAILQGAFPNHPVNPDTVRAYGWMLRDFTFPDVSRAVVTLLATSRFWPTIAEVRAAVIEERLALPTPERAWELVAERLSATGLLPEDHPAKAHPVIKRAVRAMGGIAGMAEEDNVAALRRQFMEQYAAIRAEHVTRAILAPLEAVGTIPPGEEPITLPAGRRGDHRR